MEAFLLYFMTHAFFIADFANLLQNLLHSSFQFFLVKFFVFQMDRHKYVKVAYHGFKEMPKEDKLATYGNTLIRDSFDEPDYALIDTLFSLAEAYLFAQLVDFKDKNPGKIPPGTEYVALITTCFGATHECL